MNDPIISPKPGLYIISRASSYDSSTPPYEGAERIRVIYVDERIVDDPAKITAYGGSTDWWYKEGTNHRVVNGRIRRDMHTNYVWALRIPDLIEFCKVVGHPLILDVEPNDHPHIQIYDVRVE